MNLTRIIILLLLCIACLQDYSCLDINLYVNLNANSTIEVKFANNSQKDYLFQIDTTYIGAYEEDNSKLWYDITDIYGNNIVKYNSMSGFRVFPSNELGQIWKRNSEIKDSTNRAIAYCLHKYEGFILRKKSNVRLKFSNSSISPIDWNIRIFDPHSPSGAGIMPLVNLSKFLDGHYTIIK